VQFNLDRSVRLTLGFGLAVLAYSTAARAELPPQYTVWADFAAVTAQASIPQKLGVVDRIERTGAGRYVVHSGKCFMEVVVTRAAARGPGGTPVAGPSHISGVKVGERQCK
jgi:hypothetical protein